VALAGRYPSRSELTRWAGIEAPEASPCPKHLLLWRPLLLNKDPMHFLTQPPRFLFFTGKGGVGKTSIACATAVQLAAQGKRVLLVSTDPASNVGQVFGERIGNHITRPAVPNLGRWRSTRRPPHKPTVTASSARCEACYPMR
jgi:hypothetical protein